MQVLKQYHIAFPDSPRKGQTVRTTAKTLQIGKVEWEEIARLVLLSSSASCQGKLRATLPKVHEAECHRAFNRHLLSAVDGGWRAAGTRAATGVRGGGGGGHLFLLVLFLQQAQPFVLHLLLLDALPREGVAVVVSGEQAEVPILFRVKVIPW